MSDKYPNKVAVMTSFLPTFTKEPLRNEIFTTAGELDEKDLPSELESKY